MGSILSTAFIYIFLTSINQSFAMIGGTINDSKPDMEANSINAINFARSLNPPIRMFSPILKVFMEKRLSKAERQATLFRMHQ